MTQQHPITPPQELRDKWLDEAPNTSVYDYLIDSAAQWGADQELKACCALMDDWGLDGEDLMLCRRPKPPSLKKRIAAEIENGTACDRESERITRDVIREVAVWIDRLGYQSCAAKLRKEVS
jgi:hypothetical protein